MKAVLYGIPQTLELKNSTDDELDTHRSVASQNRGTVHLQVRQELVRARREPVYKDEREAVAKDGTAYST